MPNTDTFAANQGQNRSDGFAVRSCSGTMSMPRVSMTGAVPEADAAGCCAFSMSKLYAGRTAGETAQVT